MRIKKARAGEAALSLFEVMMVVALVGTVAAFALPRIGKVKSGSDDVKLVSDVKILNSAVKVYLANGGQLPADSSVDDVITRVGRSVSTEEQDTFVGFTGSMIDNRLEATWLPEAGISSGRSRAVWNSASQRFVITEEAVPGIASFRINEDADSDPAEEQDADGSAQERTSSMSYASESNWVWDYTEAPGAVPNGASDIPVNSVPSDTAPPTATTTPGSTSGTSRLAPPVFTKAPGSYPVEDYQLSLGLTNPNPSGSSSIYFKRPTGVWTLFDGNDFLIDPDEEILAYAVADDPTEYEASTITRGTYGATPLKLRLQLQSQSQTVNYFDLVNGQGYADLRVTNLDDIPSFLREPGLFNTYYGANGADPSLPGSGTLVGTYDANYQNDLVALNPDMWNGEKELQLKAYAKSSREDLVDSSNLSTLTIEAESLPLSPPLISMQESSPGEYMITLELDGRYPPGTQIYFTTAGDPPSWDEATGQVVNGTPYVGPFALDVELEDPAEQPGDSLEIGNGVNDVQIQQVVLTSNNQRIEQNQSYYFDTLDNPGLDAGRDNEVVDNSNDRIELESITIEHEGQTIVADNVNVLSVNVTNLNIASSAQDNDVTVKRDGQVVANLGDRFSNSNSGSGGDDNSQFAREVEATLRSTNLRDYIDYSSGSKSRMSTDHDFDVMFSPLTNSDFLVVMERFGNSTFDLRPLDAAGNLIPGGNRLSFRAYSWNTGHAPSDTGGQAMFFSVIEIGKFGVNTDLNSIAGFRLNNDGGADFKFFTISDESFENREVRYTGQIQARVFPPANLRNWFDPSEVATREVEGTTTVSN
ncbi:MAG: hypothetical protein AAGF67_08390 [Verrucomicrobiota bacterium]